jgi:hypothetical protein
MKLLKYGLGLLVLLFIYWISVFLQDKDRAARMIGLDCWSNCSSQKNNTYVNY